MNVMKRILISGLLFLGVGATAGAMAAGGAGPDELLQQRADEILTALKRDSGQIRNNPAKLRALVNEQLIPVVDFEAMSKLVLGVQWKRANPEQREGFAAAFKELLVRTYTNSIKEYANVDILFYPKRTRTKDKYATVYSEFVPGSGKANVPVEYSLRNKDGSWLVYDLTIEGLSLIKNYRTSFSDEIKATSLDALIARLQKDPEPKSDG